MAPSTFASAAAGNGSNSMSARESNSEWSRRPNGATQTFRRPSHGASLSSASQQQEINTSSTTAPRYVPPHRNAVLTDARYSKDQLLDLYRAQQASEGSLEENLSRLFIGGWHPEAGNGPSNASWGRAENSRDNQPGPELCWDKGGSIEPLGLVEMDEEEKEVFSTSVNTPIKPPTTNKENQHSNGTSGRKISISGQPNTPGGYGPLSPTSTRGPPRRRETSDSYPFPISQGAAASSGPTREEQRAASPPPALQRRRTGDVKDLSRPIDRDNDTDEKASTTPLGTLRRNPTGPLSATFGAPSSPWSNGSQSAGLSPMGSFGNVGVGQSSHTEKRGSIGSGRMESRFKNVLNKDAGEDSATRSVERKPSISSLSKVKENESWRPQQLREFDEAPLAESEEAFSAGSADVGIDSETNAPYQRQTGFRGFGTPARTESRDDYGFGAFGMTSDTTPGFGQGPSRQTPTSRHRQMNVNTNEPMSPTDTNPYQSPDQRALANLNDRDGADASDFQRAPLPGLGQFGTGDNQQFGDLGGLGMLPNLGRQGGFPGTSSDRSQTSSVGGNRGFAGLGGGFGLGGMSGASAWPVTQGGLGTPSRQTAGLSNAFGGGFFGGGGGDLQSPPLAGLGGYSTMSPSAGLGGGRMGGMFSPSGQDQGRYEELGFNGGRSGQQPFAGFRNDAERSGDRGLESDELQSTREQHERSHDQQAGYFSNQGKPGQPPIGQATQQNIEMARPQLSTQPSQSRLQQTTSSDSNQPPAPQQRTMVMPDRMRWIYRDPQGQTQGPWAGLEMHDWYKAGFFSPELLVKKLEDPEYEPLAQLIRRIGNSREPFLVPQIGIPHGAGASSAGPSAWNGTGSVGSPPSVAGGAQPPFASSFPSFGTTLTAEQQNALERRKQEEQYLMARQKEHLAQAQIASRMQHHQMSGGPSQHGLVPGSGQLHHHSSAQSLHSQASLGSMTSPVTGAYHPSPSQGANTSGLFDNSFRSQGQAGSLGAVGAGVESLGHIREEEIPGIVDRLGANGRAAQSQLGAPGQPFAGQQMQSSSDQEHQERVVRHMMHDRTRLQQEQEMYNIMQRQAGDEHFTGNERLEQFQQLQGQGIIDARFQPALGQQSLTFNNDQSSIYQSNTGPPVAAQTDKAHGMSLTEQVQQAASAQQSPAPKLTGLPQPFPPAPSQSPLPAPAAQRTGRQPVADQLQTGQRDLSETPSAETPSAVAPWAKEPVEAPKGPSLKEIQAMEAKKAAQAEELALAARRQALQREMEAQAQIHAIPPAPGLPASASWAAAGGSPATPTGTNAAAWAKAAQKPTASAATKSMAQIQKEEEARKKRVAAASGNAQASGPGGAPTASEGSSYANLASKVASSGAPAATPGNSAWTTVGASGKVKTPAATTPALARNASSGVVPVSQSATSTVRKPATTRASTTTTASTANAQEEFRQWAVGELRPDLNKGISADEFVNSLVFLPPDTDIITEAVHGASSTIDSRHFADEFIRRKRLADKGLLDSAVPKSSSPRSVGVDKSGGWSEVAKKGPVKEAGASGKDDAAGANGGGNGYFKVVAAKKKGAKR